MSRASGRNDIFPIFFRSLPTFPFFLPYFLGLPVPSLSLLFARKPMEALAQGNVLLRKFHMCSYPVKVKLFKTYCTSMYTAHLWWHYRHATIKKFRITYHNVLKLLLGFSKYCSNGVVCSVFDVPSCSAIVRHLVFRFRCRLSGANCLPITTLLHSDLAYTSKIRKHWAQLLYYNQR